MPEQTRSYVAIDLKSFYASVECKERNLDPLTTNLVVADPERTTKTICLAVSPALKAYGIPGRARLFEVVRKVKEINDERKRKNGGLQIMVKFTGQQLIIMTLSRSRLICIKQTLLFAVARSMLLWMHVIRTEKLTGK